MNPEQIRAREFDGSSPNKAIKSGLWLLREIAAQLAEQTQIIRCNLAIQMKPQALVLPLHIEGSSIINNEVLADLYIRVSGKKTHCSDCATSIAPAETPGPCDCKATDESSCPQPESSDPHDSDHADCAAVWGLDCCVVKGVHKMHQTRFGWQWESVTNATSSSRTALELERLPCSICGTLTVYACSDCRIDRKITIHICTNCVNAHDKAFHAR